MRLRKTTTAFSVLPIIALLAACGDDDSTETPTAEPAPTVLKVKALRSGGAYRFNVTHLDAKAGPIAIDLRNDDDTSHHNIRVQTGSKCCFRRKNKDVGGTNAIDPGVEVRATMTLEPGRYVFLCSLSGHWNTDVGKMRGTLVVN